MGHEQFGGFARGWLDEVRQLAPRTLVVMWLVESVSTLFVNYALFRTPALDRLVVATHGIISGTLVASLISLAVVVGGVLVAWGGARGRELGLCAADIPRGAATTLAIWVLLNVVAVVADLCVGRQIVPAAGWRYPTYQFGQLAGQLFGNALFEEIVFRAVLVVQLARWIDRGASSLSRRTLVIAVVSSQVIFALGHIPNRLAFGMWHGPLDALGDLAWLLCDGIGLALVWLRTRNLFIAVGLHALSNVAALVVWAPAWATGAGLWLAFGILMVLGHKLRRPEPRAGDGAMASAARGGRAP